MTAQTPATPRRQIYTAYCGRNQIGSSADFAVALAAAFDCLSTSPASLVHIRRRSDGKSVAPTLAEDYMARGWTVDAIYDAFGRDLDGDPL